MHIKSYRYESLCIQPSASHNIDILKHDVIGRLNVTQKETPISFTTKEPKIIVLFPFGFLT